MYTAHINDDQLVEIPYKHMYQQLKNIIANNESGGLSIPEDRKELLRACATSIVEQINAKDSSEIIVICTHNSRRSQLAELWIDIASEWYGLNDIHAYSGGSESTAFNHRMIDALMRTGVQCQIVEPGKNPVYNIQFSDNPTNKQYFSKEYTHPYNPKSEFIAILVCQSADEACPTVFGARHRYFIPYVDPKQADDTEQEAQTYDEKVLEIGIEMCYMIKAVKDRMLSFGK